MCTVGGDGGDGCRGEDGGGGAAHESCFLTTRTSQYRRFFRDHHKLHSEMMNTSVVVRLQT